MTDDSTTENENTINGPDLAAARAALAHSKREWRKTTTLVNEAGTVFSEARTIHVRNGFEEAFRTLLREAQ